jgi:hypothetical protein
MARLRARPLFLSSFGAIWVCAFVSYWLQFEGLYGADGLAPAGAYYKSIAKRIGATSLTEQLRAHPSLLWLLGSDDLDVALEATALCGLLCAMLLTAGVHHGALLLGILVTYSTLFASGGTFLSFQWDLFLFETTACALVYAPCALSLHAHDGRVAHPATWVLRLLWVKFMVMSGMRPRLTLTLTHTHTHTPIRPLPRRRQRQGLRPVPDVARAHCARVPLCFHLLAHR